MDKEKEKEGVNYSFNLNQSIKVKLTEEGYEHIVGLHNDHYQRNKRLGYRTSYWYKYNRVDSDGYMTFQLWDFMQKFTSTLEDGFLIEGGIIIINSNDLNIVDDE